MGDEAAIEGISALTLATHDMARAVRFYRALGFEPAHGGKEANFTSLSGGDGYLNLVQAAPETQWGWWGRCVIYVSDVDAQYRRAIAAGLTPDFEPSDAPWGERYFHITDPDGHEISFARPLSRDS